MASPATPERSHQVPVRELNQNTAGVLDRVRHGESLEITSRGRPIARLVPVQPPPLQRLLAKGLVRPATRDLDLDSPTGAVIEGESLSDVISADREDRW